VFLTKFKPLAYQVALEELDSGLEKQVLELCPWNTCVGLRIYFIPFALQLVGEEYTPGEEMHMSPLCLTKCLRFPERVIGLHC
jgi:hypothetical protein